MWDTPIAPHVPMRPLRRTFRKLPHRIDSSRQSQPRARGNPPLCVTSLRRPGLFQGHGRHNADADQLPPCFTKLNGTLMLDPFAPGASNLARRATPAMQLATAAEIPVL